MDHKKRGTQQRERLSLVKALTENSNRTETSAAEQKKHFILHSTEKPFEVKIFLSVKFGKWFTMAMCITL